MTSPRLIALVEALAASAQPIEQALADVLAFRSLETAFGTTLDNVGTNLRMHRDGRDGASYRRFLRAKTLVLSSQGHADELLEILTALDNGFAPSEISIVEHFPAGAVMHALVPAGEELLGEAFARLINEARPATVRVILEFEENGVTLFDWEEQVAEGDPAPAADSSWEQQVAEGDADLGGTWPEATAGYNS